jgi:hypothetical protein
MRAQRSAGNKGRLLGQKPPLKPKEIWSLRIRLQLAEKLRDLALFNLAIDSKLRGCDLVSLRGRDVYQGSVVSSRAIDMQRKTERPVQFEITEATRESIAAWLARQIFAPAAISSLAAAWSAICPYVSTAGSRRVGPAV